MLCGIKQAEWIFRKRQSLFSLALAQACESIGDFDEAFFHLEQGATK